MAETAIRNLVENAIAAAPRDGHVRVAVESRATELWVLVDDDGPGLGPNADALFAPFRRGSSERADDAARGAGVGLGLAIARRTATAHGGRLTAETSPLGGARFVFVVPSRA